MKNNHNHFLIHTCDIQRPDVQIDTSTIRDRRVAKYDTVASSVRCWFEPSGTRYDFAEQLGQVPVRSWTVYFLGGQDVKEGDRLKKGSVFYLVRGVQDFSEQGFHTVCQVEEKNLAMA